MTGFAFCSQRASIHHRIEISSEFLITGDVDLSRIFPKEDYRIKMRFERGCPSRFFKASPHAEEVLAERRHWLTIAPETCTTINPEGIPLLEEVLELAAEWKSLPPGNDIKSVIGLSALEQCQWLCERWETDFLLLKPGPDEIFRLQGGGLCFPSHWDLRSKLGCTISEIHKPIPGLNATLGPSIDGFLSKIRPGISWERLNWGLSRSPELNQHPSRKLNPLDDKVALDEIWWRLENQSLVALPQSGGVLFGIRVTVHPLSEVRDNPAAREGLLQALETMSEEMATYKGISRARGRICALLGN